MTTAAPLSAPILAAGAFTDVTADAAAVRRQLDTLTTQTSDGLKAETYGGLGAASTASVLTLGAGLSRLQAWQANASDAAGRLQATQSTLSAISDIATTFYSDTNTLDGISPENVDLVAANARDALKQMANYLDTTFNGSYIFSGTDSANPPVPDPDDITSSGFFTAIQSSVSQLNTNGATATIAATLATASSNASGTSPFSAFLSQSASALSGQRQKVQLGANQFISAGILASTNGDITSTGSSTTGSYTRDIMRALATLGSLSSSQVGTPDFDSLVQDVHQSLGDAITALNSDAGVLGDRTTAMNNTATALGNTATAFTTQISNAQDVDMAATLSQLTQTQTQLQSSYQLLASLNSLSLANYL